MNLRKDHFFRGNKVLKFDFSICVFSRFCLLFCFLGIQFCLYFLFIPNANSKIKSRSVNVESFGYCNDEKRGKMRNCFTNCKT